MCVGGGQEYQGYSVTAHEFAHSIHMVGLNSVEPGFDNRLATAYSAAMSAGKWEDHYAATNKYEYWAEGVVMYFEASPTNYENHPVNTKAELQEYDPDLYSLVEEIFRGFEWTLNCP
jgi:Mlc titration factor MtfA (ptsG expression regulator)